MRENNLLEFFLKLPIIITLPIISCLIITKANAQITPDNTLGNENSIVTPGNINGLPSDIIRGGATRGGNLFHSFQDFNVLEGRGAFFQNPTGIFNILNRVTGNNISEILGTLGVLGDANLFFINPNGIIFGENASLNVNGSVVFSTADSVVFDNGFEFSASNPQALPLLTINIPIGLGLRDNLNGNISHFGNLSVPEGNSITLDSNNIVLSDAIINAPSGNITLTSDEDISITGGMIDVTGNGSGNITINAENIDSMNTTIVAGTTIANSTPIIETGDIIINARQSVTNNGSFIFNVVDENGIGNAGNIKVNASSVSITNSGFFSLFTQGQGDVGNIEVNSKSLKLSNLGIISVITSSNGNTGNIEINSDNLSLTNGGVINIVTSSNGNTGTIIVQVAEALIINGQNPQISSNIASQIMGTGGNSGGIQINSDSLSLTNGGFINADILGEGNSGAIIIDVKDFVMIDGNNSLTISSISSELEQGMGNLEGIQLTSNSLSLTDGGVISGTTNGMGDSGPITINVDDFIEIDGGTEGLISSINSGVSILGEGNSGGIQITSNSLTLTNGANINVNTEGLGDSGAIVINVDDFIEIDGQSSLGPNTGILSQVLEEGAGNSGGIQINSASLSLKNRGFISASTNGVGNSGSVVINVEDSVIIDGKNSLGIPSNINSQVLEEGIGNSSDIQLSTSTLSLINEGTIDVNTFGQGNSGNIIIDVSSQINLDHGNISSEVEVGGTGNGQEITIKSPNLFLNNGSIITAITAGDGNAGDINITESETIILESGSEITTEIIGFGISNEPSNINITSSNLILNDSDISASTSEFATGDGGNININLINDGNFDDSFITVNAENEDAAGNITLTADNLNFNNTTITTETVSGEGGDIVINTNSLLNLSNNSPLITNAGTMEGPGDGGDITINTEFFRASEDSDITANANEGNGGNISITAFGIFLDNDIDITATSELGEFGEIETNTPDIDPSDGLIDLSTNVVDGAELIGNNFCAQMEKDSEYIVTGTGGFPSNPTEFLNHSEVEVNLIPLREHLTVSETIESSTNSEAEVNQNKIEPALGWVKNEKGQVVLVNYIPNIDSSSRLEQSNTTCQPR